jgi:hypothetical protein
MPFDSFPNVIDEQNIAMWKTLESGAEQRNGVPSLRLRLFWAPANHYDRHENATEIS